MPDEVGPTPAAFINPVPIVAIPKAVTRIIRDAITDASLKTF
jgi:hypothetical protein